MALSITIHEIGKTSVSTSFGDIVIGDQEVTLENCYVKVTSVNSTKESAIAAVVFNVNNTKVVKDYPFTPKMDGSNFIAQAYEFLKTLPKFQGSIDV